MNPLSSQKYPFLKLGFVITFQSFISFCVNDLLVIGYVRFFSSKMHQVFLVSFNISEDILSLENSANESSRNVIADLHLRNQNQNRIGFCSISHFFEESISLETPKLSNLVFAKTDTGVKNKRLSKPGSENSKQQRNGMQPKLAKVTGIGRNPKVVSTAQIQTSSNETVIQAKVDVSSLVNTVIRNDGQEKTFQCSFCTYNSTYISAVKRHIEIKHMPSKALFPCQTCEKTFKLRQGLKRHYLDVHKMSEIATRALINC